MKKKGNKKKKAKARGDEREFYSKKEFVEHHGNNYHGGLWDEYLAKHEERYKLVEVQIFLKSKGKVGCAEMVRSYNDLYRLDREEWEEFKAKPWELRPTVGPYDNYQRLVAHNPLPDEFRSLYCSYDSDSAYLKFFEELKQRVEGADGHTMLCYLERERDAPKLFRE